MRKTLIPIFLAGVSAILTACGSSQVARLDAVATEQGKKAAGVNLPPWPTYCKELMKPVMPKLDEPVWGTQKRWEINMENENRRIEWCDQHYGSVVVEYSDAKR